MTQRNTCLEEVNPNLMNNSEGIQTSVWERMLHVLGVARELELKVEPEDVTELSQYYKNSK